MCSGTRSTSRLAISPSLRMQRPPASTCKSSSRSDVRGSQPSRTRSCRGASRQPAQIARAVFFRYAYRSHQESSAGLKDLRDLEDTHKRKAALLNPAPLASAPDGTIFEEAGPSTSLVASASGSVAAGAAQTLPPAPAPPTRNQVVPNLELSPPRMTCSSKAGSISRKPGTGPGANGAVQLLRPAPRATFLSEGARCERKRQTWQKALRRKQRRRLRQQRWMAEQDQMLHSRVDLRMAGLTRSRTKLEQLGSHPADQEPPMAACGPR